MDCHSKTTNGSYQPTYPTYQKEPNGSTSFRGEKWYAKHTIYFNIQIHFKIWFYCVFFCWFIVTIDYCFGSTFEIYMFSLTEQWKKMPRRVLQNSLKKLNFWVLSPEKKSFSFTFFQSIKLHSVLLMLFWSFVFI